MSQQINEIHHTAIIYILKSRHQMTGEEVFFVGHCLMREVEQHNETVLRNGEVIQTSPENRFQICEILRRYPIEREPYESDSETRDRIERRKDKVIQQMRREGHTPIVSD